MLILNQALIDLITVKSVCKILVVSEKNTCSGRI